MTTQPILDGRDTIGVLEKMMLDYFVERRRAIITELAEIDKQLKILRPIPTKAERERAAYQERRTKEHDRS